MLDFLKTYLHKWKMHLFGYKCAPGQIWTQNNYQENPFIRESEGVKRYLVLAVNQSYIKVCLYDERLTNEEQVKRAYTYNMPNARRSTVYFSPEAGDVYKNRIHIHSFHQSELWDYTRYQYDIDPILLSYYQKYTAE